MSLLCITVNPFTDDVADLPISHVPGWAIIDWRTHRGICVHNPVDVGQCYGRVIFAPPIDLIAVRRLSIDAAAIRTIARFATFIVHLGCTLARLQPAAEFSR